MTLNTEFPVPFDTLVKYAESVKPVNYGVWHGSDLYFLRVANEDAYEICFTFKITAEAAEKMINEIKFK